MPPQKRPQTARHSSTKPAAADTGKRQGCLRRAASPSVFWQGGGPWGRPQPATPHIIGKNGRTGCQGMLRRPSWALRPARFLKPNAVWRACGPRPSRNANGALGSSAHPTALEHPSQVGCAPRTFSNARHSLRCAMRTLPGSPYHRQKWPNRMPGNVAPPKLGARVDRQNPYGYRMAILYINNGDFMAQRNRLTDQAIADIKAATSAQLEKVSFGWQVVLEKGGARIALEDKTDRPVVYTSKDAAKRSLERHNEDINISLKPRF